MGIASGEMPMHASLPGDFLPCDACKENGILVVEVDNPPAGGSTVKKIVPAGACAMVPKSAVSGWLSGSPDLLERVMTCGIMCIDHETAEALGMHKEGQDA